MDKEIYCEIKKGFILIDLNIQSEVIIEKTAEN